MTYDTILERSFSRHEQKKLGYGALVGCLFMVLCFCVVFKPYLVPSLPTLNLRLRIGVGLKILMTGEEAGKSVQLYIEIKEAKPICNISKPRSDICEMNGDIRIHGRSSTIFVDSSHTGNISWNVRPYARKGDEGAMASVRNFEVKAVQNMPNCTRNHNVPGIVFSVGGYAGNNFHDFSDVVFPLYQTSRMFNGEVRFLISNKRSSSWTTKFQAIVENLSRYEIIDIDKEDGVHCFQSMIVGLKKEHEELSIDPTLSPHSMKDFRQFLRDSYSLKRESIKSEGDAKRQPRLLIISRRQTRAFSNQGEIVGLAQRLGYKVMVTETDGNLTRVSRLVNSCDVMMGVHGAGLTNMVFLPENAVLLQIVPLGGLEWLARVDFGEPAKKMKLKYLEYKISQGESSLNEQYPLDHQVFKDPFAISKRGWAAFKSVYMEKQNVNLDLGRFGATLLEARQLLSM